LNFPPCTVLPTNGDDGPASWAALPFQISIGCFLPSGNWRGAEWLSRFVKGDSVMEGVENIFSGDLATGESIWRDCLSAAAGFEKPSDRSHGTAKSMMRLSGGCGNDRRFAGR